MNALRLGTGSASAHEHLIALEAIKELKARYCRAVDAKDWTGFAAVFTKDASLFPSANSRKATGEQHEKLAGVDAIVAWVRMMLEDAVSIHHVFMPEIALVSDIAATGMWAMEDRVDWGSRSLHGFGHYVEEYALTDDGWRIASTRIIRLKVTITERLLSDGRVPQC